LIADVLALLGEAQAVEAACNKHGPFTGRVARQPANVGSLFNEAVIERHVATAMDAATRAPGTSRRLAMRPRRLEASSRESVSRTFRGMKPLRTVGYSPLLAPLPGSLSERATRIELVVLNLGKGGQTYEDGSGRPIRAGHRVGRTLRNDNRRRHPQDIRGIRPYC